MREIHKWFAAAFVAAAIVGAAQGFAQESGTAPEAPAPPVASPRSPAPEAPAPEAAPPRAEGPSPVRAPRAPLETPSADSPVPAVAPVAPLPRDVMPAGWFGFAIECFPCSGGRVAGASHPIWEFGEPPRVYHVEPESPAARAGLARGDLLTHIDGVSLTTPEGGKRFGAVTPGDLVKWQVRRAGERIAMSMTAGVRRSVEAPPAPDRVGAPPTLRYAARFGDSDIEVRGAAAVIISEDENEIVITSDGVTVRLRKRHD